MESVKCEPVESNSSNDSVVRVGCRNFAHDPHTISYKAVRQSAVCEALGRIASKNV